MTLGVGQISGRHLPDATIAQSLPTHKRSNARYVSHILLSWTVFSIQGLDEPSCAVNLQVLPGFLVCRGLVESSLSYDTLTIDFVYEPTERLYWK